MTAPETDKEIRALATARRLPDAHLKKWLRIEPDGRTALLDAARKLRLRTGQLAVALDLVWEIKVREGVGVDSILLRDNLHRLVEGQGAAPARASAFLAELRAIRFPGLGAAVRRLSEAISALGLPGGINVVLPRDLNSDELIIRLNVHSADELHRMIDVLTEKREALDHLIEMLGGSHGI